MRSRSFYCIALLVLLSQDAGWGSAQEVGADWVQTRFVDKEHITAPTGISVSPDGVVFVSCDPNATTNIGRRVGKVVRCEDTDGDGVADAFSVYIDEIDSPRGSCYVGDTLYLVQPPFLVAYQDLDDDGVAEVQNVLVKDLGSPLREAPARHGANGVRMGIDGWLYLAIGDQGCFEATGTDGSQATLYGGGVLRVRPDGSQLSVLLSGTRNIYDLAVSPYLDLFARDNTNDGGGWNTRFFHLIELADFGYPRLYKNFGHEVLAPLADYGPGAGTGVYYLHEPGYPEELGDALYSGDFNKGVFVHRWTRDGESLQLTLAPFLNLPMNTDIDADGGSRLYFSSWSGGGFGFAEEPFGHVDMVRPAGAPGSEAYTDPGEASESEMVSLLGSRSQVRRMNAMREIVVRGRNPTISQALLALAGDEQKPLYGRVAAVMALKQIDGRESHARLEALYADENLREFVVRAFGDLEPEIDAIAMAALYRALADDNPRVQLRGVVGLARAGDIDAAAALLPLAQGERLLGSEGSSQEREPDVLGGSAPRGSLSHTALKAVVHLKAIDLLLGAIEAPDLREVALRGLQEIHEPKVVSGLTAAIHTTDDPRLIKLIAIALFRLYHQEAPWDGKSWWGSRPNFAGPYLRGVAWEGTPEVRQAIQTAFAKADPADYAELFGRMRQNRIPIDQLNLDIEFDEVLSFLDKATLTQSESVQLMNAVADPERPEEERIRIYRYFQQGSLPESYLNRAQILRAWGEGDAQGALERREYAAFVSGVEFIGRIEELEPFFKNSEHECYKYAHLQLLNLLDNPAAPEETREAVAAEMEKTWADQKNLYPHRLRGLVLAFEEVDPSPYAERFAPLVDHRDERVKQAAARYLKAIHDRNGEPR